MTFGSQLPQWQEKYRTVGRSPKSGLSPTSLAKHFMILQLCSSHCEVRKLCSPSWGISETLGNQTWWVCSRTQGMLWKNSIALWKCPASLCSSHKQKVCWWTLQIVLLHWIMIDPKLLPYLFHVWLKVSLHVMNCGLTSHGDCITYSGNKSWRVT